MRKNSIGDWCLKNGARTTNVAYWHVVRNGRGTHAEIALRVLVLGRNGQVLAVFDRGDVMRGADRPATATWEPGSKESCEAEELQCAAEALDSMRHDVKLFRGYSRAMPWEVYQKPKPLWRRLMALIRGM